MRSAVFVFVFSSVIFGAVACRKSTDIRPAKYTGCRISQVTETSSSGSNKSQYTFSYNDDGTVSNIMLADLQSRVVESNKKFIYGKNFVKMGTFNSGSTRLGELDSFVLNDQKKVTDIYMNVSQGLQNQEAFHYSYDAAGELTGYSLAYSGGYQVHSFKYQDGDLIRDSLYILQNSGGTSSGGVYTYAYDTILYTTGNIAVAISDLENYGMPIATPRRLGKKEYFNSLPYISYSYSLDGEGKVIGITGMYTTTGTGTTNTQITYACE